MLGTAITVGIRKKQPKVGASSKVEEGDILNIVGGYDDVEQQFIISTFRNGIDLICTIDHLLNHHLMISVRYTKMYYLPPFKRHHYLNGSVALKDFEEEKVNDNKSSTASNDVNMEDIHSTDEEGNDNHNPYLTYKDIDDDSINDKKPPPTTGYPSIDNEHNCSNTIVSLPPREPSHPI
jgi:hypothetical protein